jgi:predicted PurR-regulated permease PerM
MKMLLSAIPDKFEEKTKKVFDDSRKLLSRYFIGLMLELLLVMICVTIGLLIVGIRFDLAITIGFFCGLFNIIPYVGPLLGGAFGLILGISNHIELDFYTAVMPMLIKMAIVFAVVQILDNNIFATVIFSNSVNAHPIEIFLVIVIAGNFGGIVGMIFAVPGYTFLRILARQFFSNFKVVRSLTKNL